MVCYCKRELVDGARVVHLDARVDWGARDLRENWQGSYDFCSFACVATWAQDRAADHDHHVVTEGANEAYGNQLPGGGAIA